ncbi:hypothetical protein SpCBS45565_g06459 [Spizellomyces sp. 'palustris']|nr:hypothetical protein SpCBS45565_g06459 [Spizellomyces sp. 'palustris']
MGALETLNARIAATRAGKWFKLEGSGAIKERRGTRFTTEVRAGLATFVTMAYIISVNANILTDSGGTCGCSPRAPSVCLQDPEYLACLADIKKDLITATSAIAVIGCFLMGTFANLPLAIAPGLGLNAYFTYQVVGLHGSGNVSYQTALAAVFIEGIIFLVLSALGLRQLLTKAVPMSIKTASAAGIGLFLTFIGLQSSAGIGLVTGDGATLVALGGCPESEKKGGVCLAHHMEGGHTWLGILGFLIIAFLTIFRVKGSILIGIIFISAVSWFRHTPVTFFPDTPSGNDAFDYFKKVVDVPRIRHIGGALDFSLGSGEVWVALITFLYVDILDTTGTMFSMAKYAGFMDESGDFEGSYPAFLSDATAITVGAVLGTSPSTAFIESGAGIAEGGRTGITALVTSFFFLLSLFFAPIFASFPPWSTGPALILVGAMMAQSAFSEINFKYLPDAIPAFLTIILMPLTYSIAYGLIAGIGSYIVINTVLLVLKKVSKGRWVPPDAENKEEWGPKEMKDLYPSWVNYLLGKSRGGKGGDEATVHEAEVKEIVVDKGRVD